ncbi:hypothetical protein Vadar_001794 [Vaccinium darrowii]|uniref:Uncharacterized protein n=1 Tax=Vaccinium darrowii TaxID=229202 RepID=A0ACB7XXI4_9ERIC|nr:hypothetical protein Vadar_001794 [Vaccinium darrowii]
MLKNLVNLPTGKCTLFLLGTTALSLVTTPVLFKLIPAMMHLGVLMNWFPSESGIQNEMEGKMKATTWPQDESKDKNNSL